MHKAHRIQCTLSAFIGFAQFVSLFSSFGRRHETYSSYSKKKTYNTAHWPPLAHMRVTYPKLTDTCTASN